MTDREKYLLDALALLAGACSMVDLAATKILPYLPAQGEAVRQLAHRIESEAMQLGRELGGPRDN